MIDRDGISAIISDSIFTDVNGKLQDINRCADLILAAISPRLPVAFRVPRLDPATGGQTVSKTEWRLFHDENEAREAANAIGVEYQKLYVRDGGL